MDSRALDAKASICFIATLTWAVQGTMAIWLARSTQSGARRLSNGSLLLTNDSMKPVLPVEEADGAGYTCSTQCCRYHHGIASIGRSKIGGRTSLALPEL
ncbi:hypothetical protein CI102_13742 [Trichoderma harzianum]|nr:hypothetical protein CI102_13742 [Trichoderma harzianum]